MADLIPPITPKSRGHRVEGLQKGLDHELKQHGFPWRKVTIDGEAGEHTFDAANMVAWLKGFSVEEMHLIGKKRVISQRDLEILIGERKRTAPMIRRGHEREHLAGKLRKQHHEAGPFPPAPAGDDWVMFDGHEVARWIAEILAAARAAGAWHGVVISGRRDPVYSEHLCIEMCGAPSCPGMCAGRSSNHAGPPSFKGVEYEGAVDVTDYSGLRSYCEAHAPELRGGGAVLPSDLPHFSHAGN